MSSPSSSSSSLGLMSGLACLAVYGYSVYYMKFEPNFQKMRDLIPAPLRVYGQVKFLTYQCLIMQLVNALLHIGAHFSSSLRGPRDLWFTTLAYPVGSIVVYSFWAVWFLMGRHLIFPVELSAIYPDWLNHATHTVIAPLNILLAFSVSHKYSRNGVAVTLVYFSIYVGFLYLIKAQTGLFVYPYLDAMKSETERVVYFIGTGVFALIMYKSGQLINSLVHQPATQRPPIIKKGAKQK